VAGGGWWWLTHPGGDKARREMMSVRSAVDKLAILPTDEEPTLATVEDKTRLTDTFLKTNADNGDKVLVYVKAKKVYIYRPSAKKLVAIGPLVIGASAAQVRGARVQVWTGNANDTSAGQLMDTVKRSYPSAVILELAKAKRQDYPSTIVIDLTEGEKHELVTNMMAQLGAQRGVLPQGEQKPDKVDVLVITGLDKRN
jgi:hypothetical protein